MQDDIYIYVYSFLFSVSCNRPPCAAPMLPFQCPKGVTSTVIAIRPCRGVPLWATKDANSFEFLSSWQFIHEPLGGENHYKLSLIISKQKSGDVSPQKTGKCWGTSLRPGSTSLLLWCLFPLALPFFAPCTWPWDCGQSSLYCNFASVQLFVKLQGKDVSSKEWQQGCLPRMRQWQRRTWDRGGRLLWQLNQDWVQKVRRGQGQMSSCTVHSLPTPLPKGQVPLSEREHHICWILRLKDGSFLKSLKDRDWLFRLRRKLQIKLGDCTWRPAANVLNRGLDAKNWRRCEVLVWAPGKEIQLTQFTQYPNPIFDILSQC